MKKTSNVKAAGKPLLKIGILTDTHIFDMQKSLKWTKKAQELFCKNKTDAVFHLGDLADVNNLKAYQRYRKVTNGVWGTPPKELFLFATHDQWELQNADEAYAIMQKGIGFSHERHGILELKGYPFLYVPQEKDEELFGKMLKDAAKKYAGKPLFILAHVPPCATTPSSMDWGDLRLRKMLDSCPSAVVLSGHTHSSLRDERCLWQKDFTAYNAGYLQSDKNACVTILEIYKDELVFRRFDLRNDAEIDPEEPWKVALPYNPANARKEWEKKKNRSVPPQFAKGKIDLKNYDDYKFQVEFPPFLPANRTSLYQLHLEENNGKGIWKEIVMEYGTAAATQESKIQSKLLEKALFVQGKQYRLTITPSDIYGNEGKSLTKEFTMTENPDRIWKFCGKVDDPMKKLSCVYADGTPVAVCQGYYLLDGRTFWMPTPEEFWKAPKGTLFRLDVEITSEQNGQKYIALMPGLHRTMVYGSRKYIPFGNHDHFRYVMYCVPKKENEGNSLMLNFVDTGKIRIDSVKVFRQEPKAAK